MIYKQHSYPGSVLKSFTYCFLKPAKLKIRKQDGQIVLMGYGIGDRISVLKYDIVYPVAEYETLEEIPLSDGSFIVEYPNDLSVRSENKNGNETL